ncbi:hypothetical protein [Achromobacter aloeverae]|uniref:Uncharacterized protein n=1 Tax=Achromobacter aloeverae TaxID=1750518 RepID=A0A4Q1HIU4_9BURK|nr:hypothetical protein [Achromobacter aloeverae]RXN87997.1 hypothetical protein C7R54_15585 [Achromobacter aloeverae]
MEAISGTRRAMKEMSDGTIRVQVDIDPACRGEFLKLFPSIDMPVALAPLVADFERPKTENPVLQQDQQLKGGELAKLAGIFCQQPEFWEFAGVPDGECARDWILDICCISSRRELDHNPVAARIFHDLVRKPYMESRK